MKKATCKNEITVDSMSAHGTLWQAIAAGTEIRVNANLDKSITVGLNVGSFRVATMRFNFRTFKARAAAMESAEKTRKMEFVAGTTQVV